MKKALLVILLAFVIAGVIGGVHAYHNHLWLFAPKETEVMEEAPVVEETAEVEIDISAEGL